MKLYVGNLNYTMTETEISSLFSAHGKVLKVNLVCDHFTRQSKCFGYVQMADRKAGKIAMKALDGRKINDRQLVIKEARSRDERDGLPW